MIVFSGRGWWSGKRRGFHKQGSLWGGGEVGCRVWGTGKIEG